MSQILYVYALSNEHAHLIEGLVGKRKLAQALGIDDMRSFALSAWTLEFYGKGQFHEILIETYGFTDQDLDFHRLTIEAAQGYVACITDLGDNASALSAPAMASGLTPLFSLPLPEGPRTDPDRARKKREARMGGMVATAALVLMLGFMGFFIWLSG